MIKFVSNYYVVLLVDVIGILSERLVEFTFNFTRFGDVKSDFLSKGKLDL